MEGRARPDVWANVVNSNNGKPFLLPYAIKRVEGARFGCIGAVLKEALTIVTPTGVAGLSFLDEAAAINKQVRELKSQDVRAIVVTIHQGQLRRPMKVPTVPTLAEPPAGPIVNIVKNLDDDVDIVISGDSHGFTNALVANKNGKPILSPGVLQWNRVWRHRRHDQSGDQGYRREIGEDHHDLW